MNFSIFSTLFYCYFLVFIVQYICYIISSSHKGGGYTMKRISQVIVVFLLIISSFSFATTEVVSEDYSSGSSFSISTTDEKQESKKIEESNASKTTIGRILTKEEKIKDYTNRFNGNQTYAVVLYYLELVREYSYPVCFVGLVIAALNYFIIGNKKLEKREQGFRMLVTLIVGLIFFQILPLLYTLVVK